MSQSAAPSQPLDELSLARGAVTRDSTRAVFGQVMGLVALTCGCAALGAYIARDFKGGAGFVLFIGAFACIFGLNWATVARPRAARDRAAVRDGPPARDFVAPVIDYYAKAQPDVL